MTWETPPVTRADVTVAFASAEGVKRWLDTQPRANADLLLAALCRETAAFNTLTLPARERFKALEILRRAALDLCAETRRRYEYKPLPLPDAAAETLAMVRRLWRALAVGYWHCLAGSLSGEPGFSEHGVRAAHHLLACLRQEQMHGELARHALADGFWALAEVALAGAEMQHGLRQEIEDRLSTDVRVSTPLGMYAMLRLLARAKPAALSRAQHAAAIRWLARWRELVDIDASFRQGSDGLYELSFDGVLRKMRKRREALAAGSSPESLKLGDMLGSAACAELLAVLGQRFSASEDLTLMGEAGEVPVTVVCGLEKIFQRLGGHGLLDDWQATTTSLVSRLRHERLALFGHEGGAAAASEVAGESWTIEVSGARQMVLSRPPKAETRLALHSLLALESKESAAHLTLLDVEALSALSDGSCCVEGQLLPGRAEPLLAAVHDRSTGRETRHPALALRVPVGAPAEQVLLPSGLVQRAGRFQLLDLSGRAAPFLLKECIARGDEYEAWSLRPN